MTFVVLLFQTLVGLRIIRFKGRRHAVVHKNAGFALLAISLAHGIMAIAFWQGWALGS